MTTNLCSPRGSMPNVAVGLDSRYFAPTGLGQSCVPVTQGVALGCNISPRCGLASRGRVDLHFSAHSPFVIRHSLTFRHSSFIIRHFLALRPSSFIIPRPGLASQTPG